MLTHQVSPNSASPYRKAFSFATLPRKARCAPAICPLNTYATIVAVGDKYDIYDIDKEMLSLYVYHLDPNADASTRLRLRTPQSI